MPSFVYILHPLGMGGFPPLKIGVAENLESRLVQNQTGNHHELAYAAAWLLPKREQAFRVEGWAHQKLMRQRIRGEWFSCDLDEAIKVCERVAMEAGFKATYIPLLNSKSDIRGLSRGWRLGRIKPAAQPREAPFAQVAEAEQAKSPDVAMMDGKLKRALLASPLRTANQPA